MLLYPKEYLDSVKDININFLQKNNIKGLILDVDNTLISLDRVMPNGILEWAQEVKNAGIKICILSNSNKIKKVENQISTLEQQINDLTNELHSDEVVNDYQKYNQISDQITDLENQLNDLLEQWEALQ